MIDLRPLVEAAINLFTKAIEPKTRQCAEDELDIVKQELSEFKLISGCDTLHQFRMWLDSQRGRVVTADALIDGFRKADPELADRIIG